MQKTGIYILYAVVIIAIAYLVYVTQGFGIWKNSEMIGGAKKSAYQAVFLSNGQVYFGHLKDVNSQYATLDDIYYLQVQKIQPKEEATNENQKLTLIKLGNEIHGPEDAMKINRDQILFWEDLKDDGKVVQAIKEYQTSGSSKQPTNESSVVPETSSPTTE